MEKRNYNGTDIYVNKFIPFHGYLAMMLFGFIFYRKEYDKYLNDKSYAHKISVMINHENIHKEQLKDFGILFAWCKPLQILFGGIIFYLLYLGEWIIRLFVNGPSKAYRNISFEKEAYVKESDYQYIEKKRKIFNQWKDYYS